LLYLNFSQKHANFYLNNSITKKHIFKCSPLTYGLFSFLFQLLFDSIISNFLSKILFVDKNPNFKQSNDWFVLNENALAFILNWNAITYHNQIRVQLFTKTNLIASGSNTLWTGSQKCGDFLERVLNLVCRNVEKCN
jgi:hypothetical protein